MTQPDDHPSAGGLLHHLLTLTTKRLDRKTSQYPNLWRLFSSADTYCHQ